MLMSTERPYHFTHLLQVSKKSLWSLILYSFSHDLIHVYSPGAGGIQPPGTSFDVNRHFWSLRSSVASFKSETTIVSEKSIVLPFFPCKSIRDQIWPCRKIGQGQPRVIIWTNLVVLDHPMAHTKIQGHRPFGSGEEEFLRFLPYMGMAAILVVWRGPFEQTFVPPSQGGSTWNLTSIGPVVSEEMFENIDIHTTYTYTHIHTHMRTPEPAYTISSPYEPKGSGELKITIDVASNSSRHCITSYNRFSSDYIWGV